MTDPDVAGLAEGAVEREGGDLLVLPGLEGSPALEFKGGLLDRGRKEDAEIPVLIFF